MFFEKIEEIKSLINVRFDLVFIETRCHLTTPFKLNHLLYDAFSMSTRLDIIHIYYCNKLVFTDPYTDCVLHNGTKTGYYVIDNKHYVITKISISIYIFCDDDFN